MSWSVFIGLLIGVSFFCRMWWQCARSAKPKGSICSLVKWADTAFWLCTACTSTVAKSQWFNAGSTSSTLARHWSLGAALPIAFSVVSGSIILLCFVCVFRGYSRSGESARASITGKCTWITCQCVSLLYFCINHGYLRVFFNLILA